MINYLKKADIDLLNFINKRCKCRFLDIIMPYITFFGSATFCMIFAIITILSRNRTMRNVGVLSCMSIITSSGIAQMLKRTKNRIRPYIKFPGLNVRKIGVDDYSFPSGHTTAAFSIGLSIALSFGGFATIAIIAASLVGFSRIYLGVHYPTDVAAGVIVGTLSTFLIYSII